MAVITYYINQSHKMTTQHNNSMEKWVDPKHSVHTFFMVWCIRLSVIPVLCTCVCIRIRPEARGATDENVSKNNNRYMKLNTDSDVARLNCIQSHLKDCFNILYM